MSADLEIRHQNIALALGKVVEAAEFNTPALARLAFASMAEVLAECDPFDEIEVGALVALYAVKVGQ